MSPRWILNAICLSFVLFAMTPDPVSSQWTVALRLLRGAVCTACSGAFVLQRCAPTETILCRVIAFKLRVLCQTYPCINYGGTGTRTCEEFPLGCSPLNIRVFGLCEPRQICCSGSGVSAGSRSVPVAEDSPSSYLKSVLSGFKSKTRRNRSKFSFRKSAPSLFTKPKFLENLMNAQTDSKQDTILSTPVNQTGVYIPSDPEKYTEDWPVNEDNPTVIEKAIRQQFDKFMLELHAINQQETQLGKEAVRIPSFEEFRSAALGGGPL